MKKALLIAAGVFSLACGAAYAEGGCSYGKHHNMAEITESLDPLLAQPLEVAQVQEDALFRAHAGEPELPKVVIHN